MTKHWTIVEKDNGDNEVAVEHKSLMEAAAEAKRLKDTYKGLGIKARITIARPIQRIDIS